MGSSLCQQTAGRLTSTCQMDFLEKNLPAKSGKREQHHWILHIQISLDTKVQLKLTILFFFLDQIWPKIVFPVENRNSELHYWILQIPIIPISLHTKFQLKKTIQIFWIKFAQKRYFWSKTKKVNITTEFCILELDLVRGFNLNWQFWFFGQNIPQRVFPVKSRQSKHHH